MYFAKALKTETIKDQICKRKMHENYFNKRISNLIGMKLRFYSLKNSLLIYMHLNKIASR